jgi:hypothetical protein
MKKIEMQEKLDITDLLTVATRIKRMSKGRYPAFMGSAAFKSEFTTLLDLIDKLKEQNALNN